MRGTSNVKISESLIEKSEFCLKKLREQGMRVGFAESCTGGLLTFILCMHPGASEVVECGLVTYSNGSKEKILGVSQRDLAEHSAVSKEVAASMAEGLLLLGVKVDIAVAITGYAGNSLTGDKNEANAGYVVIARAERNTKTTTKELRLGNLNRYEIQCKAAAAALDVMISKTC